MHPTTKTNVLQTAQRPCHQRCVQRQQPSIANNSSAHVNYADTDTTPITDNPYSPFTSSNRHSNYAIPPRYQHKEEEKIHGYVKPSENSTHSALRQRQYQNSRRRRLLLKPQSYRKKRSISLPQRIKLIDVNRVDNGSNINKGQSHQLNNPVTVVRTRTPIVHPPPLMRTSVEDQLCHSNDENSHPTIPNDASPCVSSLPVDESSYYSSDLTFILQNPYPNLHNNNSDHPHHLELHKLGETKVGEIIPSPHDDLFHQNIFPVRTSSRRGDGDTPHGHTFASLRIPSTFSTKSTAKKRYCARDVVQCRSTELENTNEKEVVVRQHKRIRSTLPHGYSNCSSNSNSNNNSALWMKAMNDDLKYLVEKILPAPLRGMEAVMIKKKMYNLKCRGGQWTR